VTGVTARLALAWRLLRFGGWFLVELTRANLEVVWDVLTPRSRLQPGIVGLPLRTRSDLEVALLSGLITLTPGTLTLSVREQPATMFVHGMYSPDAEAFRTQLDELQLRLLRAVRLHGPDVVPSPGTAGEDLPRQGRATR
jgi:multicomponent Na+:H+ antiporter subunit E